jgi:hypothetical protein
MRFVDLVEAEISPGTVSEQLSITFPIKLNCAILFCFGSGDPLVESRLKLPQRRNALLLFITRGSFPLRLGFFEASRLANNASPCRASDSFCFTTVFGPSRAIVFLASVLEFVGVDIRRAYLQLQCVERADLEFAGQL